MKGQGGKDLKKKTFLCKVFRTPISKSRASFTPSPFPKLDYSLKTTQVLGALKTWVTIFNHLDLLKSSKTIFAFILEAAYSEVKETLRS